MMNSDHETSFNTKLEISFIAHNEPASLVEPVQIASTFTNVTKQRPWTSW